MSNSTRTPKSLSTNSSLGLVLALAAAVAARTASARKSVGFLDDNDCDCERKVVNVLSRRVWVCFVVCISKQSPVIGPNSALVIYVVNIKESRRG